MLYDDYRFNQFKQHGSKCMIHWSSSIYTGNMKLYVIMNFNRVTNLISSISIRDHRVNLLVPSLEL